MFVTFLPISSRLLGIISTYLFKVAGLSSFLFDKHDFVILTWPSSEDGGAVAQSVERQTPVADTFRYGTDK